MTIQHIYARLSPNPEGFEKEEQSVEDQIAALVKFVEDKGRTVGQIFRDDGISATRRGVVRDGFESLLVAVQQGDRIAVWDLDRFIRTTRDLLRVIDTGVMVDAMMTGHVDLSNPAGIAVAKTVTAWAEYEGQHKADRQRFAHANRAARGIPFHGGSSRPFGYHKAVVDGVRTYLPHEEEGPWVTKAFDMFLRGNTLGHIARALNRAGVKTAYDKKRKGEAPTQEWTYQSVSDLLRHPRYASINTYNGKEICPGNWPALVTEETYRATVRKLSEKDAFRRGPRMGKNGIVHWLSGVVFCEVCGSRCGVLLREGLYVYRCVKGHASARKEWLEDIALAQISTRLTAPITTAVQETSADLTVLHDELDRLRLKSEEIAHALAEDVLTLSQFGEANKVLRPKIAALEKKIASVGFDRTMLDLLDVDNMETHWSSLSDRERNAIAKSFFEKIEIRRRGAAERLSRGHAVFSSRHIGSAMAVDDSLNVPQYAA